MPTMLDAVTDVLSEDVKDCLADFGVDDEAVRGDVEFHATMQAVAQNIIFLIENGQFDEVRKKQPK